MTEALERPARAAKRTGDHQLNDKRILATKPPSKGLTILRDGPRLFLYVHATGSKIWTFKYSFGGKESSLSLGAYPGVGLSMARAEWGRLSALLDQGINPAEHRRAEAEASRAAAQDTFIAIANELLAKKGREGKAEETIGKNRWLLEFAKSLHSRPIRGISAAEVLTVLRAVEEKGLHETAHRLRALTGQIFRFAIATARADVDPTYALRGALTAPQTKSYGAILDPLQFGGLLRAVRGYGGQRTTAIALELLALTMLRPGELRAARWSEVDRDAGVLTIPAERMKGRRPHIVPLSGQALALLEELHPLTGRFELLFPSIRIAARPISENTLGGALKALGYSSDQHTAHGFRSSASSMLNASNRFHPDAIERQLAHLDPNEVRRTYDRSERMAERKEMLQWLADHYDELREGGKVIELTRRAR